MSVIGRSWTRLTPAGKVVLPLLIVLALLLVVTALLWMLGIIPLILSFALVSIQQNIDVFRFLLAVTAILLFTVPTAFIIIFLEMKVIAFINLRLGPNRIGPWGTLSSTIHGFKVLAKEDFTPTGADVPVFTLAPAVVYLGAIMSFLVLPFAPGVVGLDLNLGLLYFFAVTGLAVVGLMMAGWSSFNKYSLLGGLRSAAQIISYEIPLTLSVVGVIMLSGTLSLNQIVLNQAGWFWDWYVFQQPLAFVIFFIAATAEGNRTPFDLAEADSEIVAGFATEYSGMRFGFFFFAEYVSVFVLSALTVTLFFGGWNAPIDGNEILRWLNVAPPNGSIDLGSLGIALLFLIALGPPILIGLLALPFWMLKPDWSIVRALAVGFLLFNLLVMAAVGVWLAINFEAAIGLFWFFAKTYFFVVTFVWMRGTLPRVRIDQLMGFAWKWLLPASVLNLFITAVAILGARVLRGELHL